LLKSIDIFIAVDQKGQAGIKRS